MDARIAAYFNTGIKITPAYTAARGVPLQAPNPAYRGADLAFVSGNNLVRKAAQLVADIEALKDKPSFASVSGKGSAQKPPDFTVIAGKFPVQEQPNFQDLVDNIKAELAKNGKEFTLLNVTKAHQSILQGASAEKQVDQKA